MIRPAILAALFVAAFPAAGGAQSTAQPTERRFAVGRFDAIELDASDSIRVVTGPTISVVASGDPRAVAALAITVRGNTLHVARRPGTWRDRGALVTVTMPELREAAISGSGGLRADAVRGRSFTGRLSGSGGMTLTDLRTGTVQLDLSGSGSIVATGTADRVGIDLGGSGRIDTHALATSAVAVDLGGSGAVIATATRTATITTGGSGSVRVSGGPRCDVRKGGSATVRCG